MADYLSKRGANIAPSYAAIADLPASTQVGDLVFVGGQLGIAVNASTFNTCDKTDISTGFNWASATQQAKMQASDVAGALLGGAIAIDTDTLVVGARKLNSNTGAAYVFTRSGTSWSQQAKLTGSDITTNDLFGWSVDISGDTIVVGAKDKSSGSTTNTGAAYVFTRSGTSWSQQANFVGTDTAAGHYFGQSVQIENDTIVASAAQINSAAGAVYVFTRSGTSWSQQAKLTASDAAANDYLGYHSGNSIAISGDTVVAGAYGDDDGGSSSGSAYVFTRSGTSWSQQAKLTASDAAAYNEFGNATAIEGDTIVIGSHQSDNGGFYVDYTGSAYIYTRSGTSWTQVKKIQSSDIQAGDNFGKSVAIYSNTIVAGAWGEDTGANLAGAAYAFTA